jgi:hypothetical protein
MNRKRTLVALFVASLVATMAMVYLFSASMSEPTAAPPAGADGAVEEGDGDASRRAGRREPREPSPRSEEEQENLEDRLVMMLRSLYGDRISNTTVQILMAQVRTQVQTLFPMDWASRFPKILEKAFPGYSARILATLSNVDAFDRWLSSSEEALAKLSPEERDKAMRAKKAELFGEQAAEELDAEARASEQRDQAMGETMRSLEGAADTTIDQKLDVFTNALQKNYGDGPSAIALENGSMLSQAFFGLESVSRQLGALDPETRQEKINEIRRQFGYDDEQIAALEEDDREREADWQQGYAYMKERRALEQSLSGEELDRQIAALRQRYFGDVSHTIRLEEEEGFFRYERPRLYGRN